MSYSFQALHYIFYVHTNNSCCNSFFSWLNNQNESQAYDFSESTIQSTKTLYDYNSEKKDF